MPVYDFTYNETRAQGQRIAWTIPSAGGTTYTEIGRWNDIGDYRNAGDADYTNFGGVSWCANRGPLNNVADPFPLNTSTTYRLRYVQGGSATQASAEVIGTPTQAHIDSSPGGGIACYRFGTAANMTAAFGTPISNPGSPPSFHGGQWILETQGTSPAENEYRLVYNPVAAQGSRLSWVRRTALANGTAAYAYDTDTSNLIWRGIGTAPPVDTDRLLRQDGDHILRQDGSFILLQRSD